MKILRRLREAAQPHTQLILQDFLMQHACSENTGDAEASDLLVVPPEPLLANWGRANSEMYHMDMQVRRPA